MGKNSYENINYSVRPGKAIERKMLIELMQRLSLFDKIENYQYVGFGSTYFTDFTLIHKNLGVKKMISIEKDIHNQSRFMFNVPFSCIKMEFHDSNDILPNIDWHNCPSILWLDYDDKLEASMFKDVQTYVANALSGSLFFISVNAHPFDYSPSMSPDEIKEFRLKTLIDKVGDEKVSSGINGSELNLGGLSKVYQEMINDEINSVLRIRNNSKSDDNPEKLFYKQLVNFTYRDGAKMLTVGGIIYSKSQENQFSAASFDDLEFYRDGNESFDIKVPNLTFRELYKLDSLLPSNLNPETGEFKDESFEETQKIEEFIPLVDALKYSKIYRYFPAFTESVL